MRQPGRAAWKIRHVHPGHPHLHHVRLTCESFSLASSEVALGTGPCGRGIRTCNGGAALGRLRRLHFVHHSCDLFLANWHDLVALPSRNYRHIHIVPT